MMKIEHISRTPENCLIFIIFFCFQPHRTIVVILSNYEKNSESSWKNGIKGYFYFGVEIFLKFLHSVFVIGFFFFREDQPLFQQEYTHNWDRYIDRYMIGIDICDVANVLWMQLVAYQLSCMNLGHIGLINNYSLFQKHY